MPALPGHLVLIALASVLLAGVPCSGQSQKLPCTVNHTVVATDTCNRIVAAAGLFLTDLHNLNPSLNASCANLLSFKVGKAGGT